MPGTPLHVTATQGKAYSVLGDRYIFKVTGAETGGAYALFDCLILPGNGAPPHIHRREDEVFWGLSGELCFYVGIGRARVVLKEGEHLYSPRDVPHYFVNESKAPCRVLIQVLPAGLENFFAAIGTPLASPEAPPLPLNQAVDVPKVLGAAPNYGIELLLTS